MIRTAVSLDDIDLAGEIGRLEALGAGGVATFTGIVRAENDLDALHLETWPVVAEDALRAITTEATRRWPLLGATLIHRYGTLRVGERIVFVGTASLHRAAALDACAFLIDWAKTKAPFWKREDGVDGSARWIDANAADDVAANRWG